MVARIPHALAAALALAGAGTASAANPSTYAVGTLPASPGVASVELPLGRGLATELGVAELTVGGFDDKNPFANLSAVAPLAWLHLDGVPNLRLSAGYQQLFYFDVAPQRMPNSHEERVVLRGRYQQPRGAAALYEMLQLDTMRFEDPGGTRRLVFRPRLRVGQGFNLDAVRIHSLILYQELAFRFSEAGYAARAFDFFRAFAGYMWTTQRGTFVTLGVVGQISLNPAATSYTFLLGPAIGINYRFRAQARPETPPPGPDVDLE
jgi:hypothetical protein